MPGLALAQRVLRLRTKKGQARCSVCLGAGARGELPSSGLRRAVQVRQKRRWRSRALNDHRAARRPQGRRRVRGRGRGGARAPRFYGPSCAHTISHALSRTTRINTSNRARNASPAPIVFMTAPGRIPYWAPNTGSSHHPTSHPTNATPAAAAASAAITRTMLASFQVKSTPDRPERPSRCRSDHFLVRRSIKFSRRNRRRGRRRPFWRSGRCYIGRFGTGRPSSRSSRSGQDVTSVRFGAISVRSISNCFKL